MNTTGQHEFKVGDQVYSTAVDGSDARPLGEYVQRVTPTQVVTTAPATMRQTRWMKSTLRNIRTQGSGQRVLHAESTESAPTPSDAKTPRKQYPRRIRAIPVTPKRIEDKPKPRVEQEIDEYLAETGYRIEPLGDRWVAYDPDGNRVGGDAYDRYAFTSRYWAVFEIKQHLPYDELVRLASKYQNK